MARMARSGGTLWHSETLCLGRTLCRSRTDYSPARLRPAPPGSAPPREPFQPRPEERRDETRRDEEGRLPVPGAVRSSGEGILFTYRTHSSVERLSEAKLG